MTWDVARAAIYERMRANWTATKVAYDNQRGGDSGIPPADANGQPLPWIALEVRWNRAEQASIGAPGQNLARRMGHIWITAWMARGTDAVLIDQLAAQAAAILEAKDFGGVVTEAAMPSGPADDGDGVYDGQAVAIPYELDEAVL